MTSALEQRKVDICRPSLTISILNGNARSRCANLNSTIFAHQERQISKSMDLSNVLGAVGSMLINIDGIFHEFNVAVCAISKHLFPCYNRRQ